MINTHDNVWIPSEGYKYITNGVAFSTEIRLGFKDSISNWHDTNEEPPTPPEPPTPKPHDYEQGYIDGYDQAVLDNLEE